MVILNIYQAFTLVAGMGLDVRAIAIKQCLKV